MKDDVLAASTGSTHREFMVPKDGPTYIEQVRTRCHDLIQCKIWEGLHVGQLNQWLSNFKSDDERYFAACLLDNVIYRSEAQTRALVCQLVQRTLPDHGRMTNGITDWIHRLRQKSIKDTTIRIVPVIPPETAATKSAHFVARYIQKIFEVQSHLFADPEDVPRLLDQGIEAIVFVDDILATGTQFVEEFASHYIPLHRIETNLIYAPLVAHDQGVRRIQAEFPSVSVACVERLGPEHALFGPCCGAFKDGENTRESAWRLYLKILSTRGINDPIRGFGDLELAYFFQHSTPDNCLPIYWHNGPNWKPLFHR